MPGFTLAKIMDQVLTALLESPVGSAVQLSALLLLLMKLWHGAITLFSLTTKELSRERNKVALRAICDYIRRRASDIRAPAIVRKDAGTGERAVGWLDAALYCLFVGWFLVEATALLIVGLIRLQTSVWAEFIVIFALVLYVIAEYFRRLARRVHCSLL